MDIHGEEDANRDREGGRETEIQRRQKKWREQRIYPEKQAPTERDTEKDVWTQSYKQTGAATVTCVTTEPHVCCCSESSPLGADGGTASFVCVFVS